MNEWNEPNREDLEHLNLLGIFYFVLAALCLPGVCILVLHVTIGLSLLTGEVGPAGSGESPAAFGGIFVVVGLLVMLGFAVVAGLALMAGRNLRRRQGRTFCLVVGALACIHVPIGTVLGVFTIVVLNRPSVRALFEANEGGAGRMEFPSRGVSER